MNPTSKRPEDLRKEVEKSIEALTKQQVSEEPRVARIDMNVDPRMLPLSTIDIAGFLGSVTQLFRSRFDRSTILKHIPPNVPQDRLADKALVEFAVESDKIVQFLGGVITFPDLGRITPIDRMGFGKEQVSAIVFGTTDEATYVAKQLCLEIWKAAGGPRQWVDIQPYVERVRYKTTTRVHLKAPLAQLLSQGFRGVLADHVSGGDKIGRSMGLVPSDPARLSDHIANVDVLWHCRDITLMVTTCNQVSGQSENNELRLSLEAMSDANSNRALVTSELPSALHAQLVNQLVAGSAP